MEKQDFRQRSLRRLSRIPSWVLYLTVLASATAFFLSLMTVYHNAGSRGGMPWIEGLPSWAAFTLAIFGLLVGIISFEEITVRQR